MSKTEKMPKRRVREKPRRKKTKFSMFDTIFYIFAVSLLIGAVYYFFFSHGENAIEYKSGIVPRTKNEKSNTKSSNVITENKLKESDRKNKDNIIKPKTKVKPVENDDKEKDKNKQEPKDTTGTSGYGNGLDKNAKDSKANSSNGTAYTGNASKGSSTSGYHANGSTFSDDNRNNHVEANDESPEDDSPITGSNSITPPVNIIKDDQDKVDKIESPKKEAKVEKPSPKVTTDNNTINPPINPIKKDKPVDQTDKPKKENINTEPVTEKDLLNYGELPPLFLVIKNDDLNVFEAAIKGKVNLVDEISGAGFNLLHYATCLMKVDVMRFIIENNMIPVVEKIKDGQYAGITALHLACLAAEKYPDRVIEAVELLLNNMADIYASDGKGFTPIFSAVQSGHTQLVEHLLSKDSKLIESRSKSDNSTLLHFAMNSCKRPMLKLLIDKDSTMMHAINDFNFEPIHQAAASGCVDGLKELILTRNISKHHKSPAKNATNFKQKYKKIYLFGATPLHFAAKFDKIKAVEFLFLIQSDFNAKDENGHTAQDIAETARVSKPVRDYFFERLKWETNRSTNQDIEFLLREAEENYTPAEIEDFYNEMRRTDLHI